MLRLQCCRMQSRMQMELALVLITRPLLRLRRLHQLMVAAVQPSS